MSKVYAISMPISISISISISVHIILKDSSFLSGVTFIPLFEKKGN